MGESRIDAGTKALPAMKELWELKLDIAFLCFVLVFLTKTVSLVEFDKMLIIN